MVVMYVTLIFFLIANTKIIVLLGPNSLTLISIKYRLVLTISKLLYLYVLLHPRATSPIDFSIMSWNF
jgi:hypothetical protein